MPMTPCPAPGAASVVIAVPDGQLDAIGEPREAHLDAAAVAVPERVRERLLQDAVHRELHGCGRLDRAEPDRRRPAGRRPPRAPARTASRGRRASAAGRRPGCAAAASGAAARPRAPSARSTRSCRAPRSPPEGSDADAYRAPSACAMTTASECATTSCMSRAMRTRSCSATVSSSARRCASRFSRARMPVRTSAPTVQASSSAKVAAMRTAAAVVIVDQPGRRRRTGPAKRYSGDDARAHGSPRRNPSQNTSREP